MEVSLSLLLADHAGLLQQVVVDVAPDGVALEVEVDVHVLPEPGGVVVPVGLSIAECLENIIGGQEHFFHPLYLVLLRHICNLNMEIGEAWKCVINMVEVMPSRIVSGYIIVRVTTGFLIGVPNLIVNI